MSGGTLLMLTSHMKSISVSCCTKHGGSTNLMEEGCFGKRSSKNPEPEVKLAIVRQKAQIVLRRTCSSMVQFIPVSSLGTTENYQGTVLVLM